MKTISIRNKNIHGDKFSVTVDVEDGGREVLSKVVEARSKNELDNTLANILTLAEQVESDFTLVEEGVWTPPVEPAPEPTPDPTAEELKQQQISALEMELEQEYERAKKDKEMAELAKTDTKLAEKIAEVETLKTKK